MSLKSRLKRFKAEREKISQARSDARVERATTRIKRRTFKKKLKSQKKANKYVDKYGDLDSSVYNDAAAATPDAASALADQGVQVDDPNDPVEVMTKTVQENPDMESQMDDESYDQAFFNAPDYYDGDEKYEHFDWKSAAKRLAGGAFKGTVAEFKKYTGELKAQKAGGATLDPVQAKLLTARLKADAGVKDSVMDEIKGYLPWVVGLLLFYILIRKFV